MDDIPEAIRETVTPKSSSQLPVVLILGGVAGLGAIALLSGFLFSRPSPQLTQDTSAPKGKTEEVAKAQTTEESSETNQTSEIKQTTNQENSAQTNKSITADDLLGHLPYEEVSQSELTSISADGRIKLRHAAAQKFKDMQLAAKADGVLLNPISAFRTISQQDHLFFRVKEQRVQGATKRAEVSAPPGYSEHHTGYAIDIGDAKVPATNVEVEFENTAAFRWLQANAARYSFELSFPRNNPQGISYEPWHWRFVGDRHSLETFYKARTSEVPN